MKHKKISLIIAVALLLCLVIAMIGCTATTERGVVSMLKQLPENTNNFNFTDYKAVLSPSEQEGMSSYFESQYGIYFNDFDYAISCYDDGDYCEIFSGDFDLSKTRNNLESLGYNKGEYKGIELWESESKSVALKKNLAILGGEDSVRNSIEVIKGERKSLWDNQDIKDLVDRLPDATSIESSLYGSGEGVSIYFGGEAFRCYGQGISMEMTDEENMKITWVYIFNDEDTTHNAVEKMEEEAKPEELVSYDIYQDGRFMIVTVEGPAKALW